MSRTTRDKSVILLLYGVGLRINEALSLKLKLPTAITAYSEKEINLEMYRYYQILPI